jgi:hypothetical protein
VIEGMMKRGKEQKRGVEEAIEGEGKKRGQGRKHWFLEGPYFFFIGKINVVQNNSY